MSEIPENDNSVDRQSTEVSNQSNLFTANPKVVENYSLLHEIGIFDYIEFLDREVENYRNLFSSVLDIFNRITIEEIIDAAVWQISDHFLPSVVVFLWKPLQNREDIIIKSFKNYKPVDLKLNVDNISAFEPFFRSNPRSVRFDVFSKESGQNETVTKMGAIEPELVIPILGPSGLYGLVLMGQKITAEKYSEEELAFLQRLMSFVSQAVQNHLHYERTLRDEKTGLYNNGFLLNRLNEEIARSKRTGSVAAIIMADVDLFKNFNDTYGHLAGDRVLEGLAITLKQAVRTGDVPSRFGGEEFTILLPDADREQAWLAAERLRTMVADMKVHWDPPLPQVTISLGVFSFDKDTGLEAEEIIRRADEALYLSKERGRNRTTVWGSGLYEKIRRMEENPGLSETADIRLESAFDEV